MPQRKLCLESAARAAAGCEQEPHFLRASRGTAGSGRLTNKQLALRRPGRQVALPCSAVLLRCVCCWACLVLMLGTEKTSWSLFRMVKFNLFLLDIPTQRKKTKKEKMGR